MGRFGHDGGSGRGRWRSGQRRPPGRPIVQGDTPQDDDQRDDQRDGATASGPNQGRITAVKPQVRDPERVSVFLDGVFAFGLGAQLALDHGLSVGDDLDAARAAARGGGAATRQATNAALALLAHRPRSLREVRDRLRQKGYGPETIEAAVAKLEGWRYVDDADFARYWVENRQAHKPRGRRLLEQELRIKGVERETVREAIDAAEIDEHAAAVAVGRAKLRSYEGLEPAVARRRLAAYLARRGFGFDVVRPALEVLLGEGQEDETDEE